MRTFFLLTVLGFACGSGLSAQCDTIPVVADTVEFKTMLTVHPGVVLDVRTSREFSTGHIKGAVNIDFRSADFNYRIAQLDTSKTYYLYCEVGGRSRMAAEYMISKGFCRVVTLQGGIVQWKKAGYPVEVH